MEGYFEARCCKLDNCDAIAAQRWAALRFCVFCAATGAAALQELHIVWSRYR
ncbi:MAG: hypothetical protein ACLU3G_09770 [Christensenellales bacterium]